MKKVKNIEEIIGVGMLMLLLAVAVVFGGCTSFDRIKSKYGNKSIEIETIPYKKEITADSAMIYTRLDGLRPNIPVTVSSDRSRITLMADASGGLIATAYSFPVYIFDTLYYPVEKVVFKEADLGKYILKKEADREKKLAVEMAVLEAQMKQAKKDNKLTFFDKVKNTAKDIGLGLGLLVLIALIILFVARRIANRFLK